MPPGPEIRVLVVEDHQDFRAGLVRLLKFTAGIAVIAEADNGADAVEKCRSLHPDVVTMDINMPRLSGIDATRQILEIQPDSKILIVSSESEPTRVTEALSAGVMGYVSKRGILPNLAEAVIALANSRRFLCPDTARALGRPAVP